MERTKSLLKGLQCLQHVVRGGWGLQVDRAHPALAPVGRQDRVLDGKVHRDAIEEGRLTHPLGRVQHLEWKLEL